MYRLNYRATTNPVLSALLDATHALDLITFSIQTGSGRVTVFTHHNYIHDRRRKKYKDVPWCKRPPHKGIRIFSISSSARITT